MWHQIPAKSKLPLLSRKRDKIYSGRSLAKRSDQQKSPTLDASSGGSLPMKTTPGQYLKEVRQRLGMSLRDVQDASAVIAAEEGRHGFFISAAHMNRIEMDVHTPSALKLFTICAVYALDMHDVMRRYGADASRLKLYRERFLRKLTRPVSSEIYGTEEKMIIPIRLDPSFRWQTTTLINRVVAQWGEVPAAFLVGCNPRQRTYAYIGEDDLRMQPLIRPGSLVMIDTRHRRVEQRRYENEFDRPIYFIELRNGYRCAWCEIAGSRLRVIPAPASGYPVENFSLPNEAEVVGQVVNVAMRLAPAEAASAENELRSQVQSAVAK